jgi:hypothetical protein
MKAWLFTLPLLFAFNVAAAAEENMGMGAAEAGPPASTDKAMAPKPRKRRSMHRTMHRKLPSGDLRYCLELKDNTAIIKCAETRR